MTERGIQAHVVVFFLFPECGIVSGKKIGPNTTARIVGPVTCIVGQPGPDKGVRTAVLFIVLNQSPQVIIIVQSGLFQKGRQLFVLGFITVKVVNIHRIGNIIKESRAGIPVKISGNCSLKICRCPEKIFFHLIKSP